MAAILMEQECPVYETASFMLRLVRLEDAQPLLACYWPKEYSGQRYVRFAVIPKKCRDAVGTIEIFGEYGILRMDLASAYDKPEYIEEFLRLAVLHFIRDFQIVSLKIKASDTPERIPLLKKYGFVPSAGFRPESGYFERPVRRFFDAGKGIAFCGLACCVCSENQNCDGCRSDHCQDKGSCKNYHCCQSKKLEGCWVCSDFPCDCSMFGNLRVKAFAKYAAENGMDRLILALKNNEECGVIYHYCGQLNGDYDLFQTEEEIVQLINRGV